MKHGRPALDKIPFNARTLKKASTTDSDTWSSFDEAVTAWKTGAFAGIGYVFSPNDPYAGIDLDGCIDRQSGAIAEWALALVKRFASYAEVSISGDGIHIILKGVLPTGWRKKGTFETYDQVRFFTMTGARLADAPPSIEERGQELAAWHTEVASSKRTGRVITDEEFIGQMRAAKNGEKFARLWSGDTSGYPSQNEADLALVDMLVWWCNGDGAHADRLFRRSSLMREKWDERHYADGRTYGQETIAKAVTLYHETAHRNGNGNGRTPAAAPSRPSGDSTRMPLAALEAVGFHKALADDICADDHFAQDAGGKLYRYDGGAYKPDGEAHVLRRVKALVTEWGLTAKWNPDRAKAVAEFIRVDAPYLWDRPSLDTINVLNGLLDVATRQLRPHTPEYLSPIQLAVAYDPEATCPAWETFIADTFPKDSQAVAWEIPAWLMTPDTSIQKAILLDGEGSNGKSTYLTGVTAFLGRRNTTNLSLHKLEQDRFAAARLVGKLANICPDLPSAHLTTTSIFKALTGGDPVTGEYKYRDSFEFLPYCRLVFSSNHPPRSGDGSFAFFRRWIVVPFTRTFEGDRAIPRKVLDARLADPRELSGVLNRALDALPRLRAHGFTESASMRAAWEEFRKLTDPLSVWLDRTTVEHPDAMVIRSALLGAYNDECRTLGQPPMTATAFSLALKRLRPNIREAQRTIAGKVEWVWLGIGLKAHDPEAHPPTKPGAKPPRSASQPTAGESQERPSSQGSQGSQGSYIVDRETTEDRKGEMDGERSAGGKQYSNPVNPVNPVNATPPAPGSETDALRATVRTLAERAGWPHVSLSPLPPWVSPASAEEWAAFIAREGTTNLALARRQLEAYLRSMDSQEA